MVKPRFFITDVFTTVRYGGNPLATFVDCDSLSDGEMQAIAREINFSETTFITSAQPASGSFGVRMFTPKEEVPFAGHPVLGTAHVIRNRLGLSVEKQLVLELGAGPVTVTFTDSAFGRSVLWMQQPAPQFGCVYSPGQLSGVLGISAGDIEPDWPIEEVSTGFPHIVVPLKCLDSLRQVRIDRSAYFELVADAWAKIILVFCREGYTTGQELAVRVFAEYYGIAEDAATGSGNGCLAAWLIRHQVYGTGSLDLRAGQGCEIGRPSELALRTEIRKGTFIIRVGGSVVDVAEGHWG